MATEDDDKEFEAAFTEAAAKGVEAAAEELDQTPAAPAKVEPPKGEAPAKVEPPQGEEPPVKTAEEIAAEALAVKATQEAEIRVAAETKVRQDAEARVALETKTKKDAEDRVAAEAAAKAEHEARLAPHVPTAEQKTAMEQFKKDFPNEYAAVQAQLEGERKSMSAEIYKAVQEQYKKFDEMVSRVTKRVESTEEVVAAGAQEKHVAAILAAHTDAEVVIPLLPAWIEKQPAYLKKAMETVYKEGSTREIVDLLSRFKKDTGREEAVPAAAATPAVPAKPKPSAVEIASGMPVTSKRAAPSTKGAPDTEDFDGAWEEAAA